MGDTRNRVDAATCFPAIPRKGEDFYVALDPAVAISSKSLDVTNCSRPK